jgi:ElaB/YqjD/DUF883 family membrane-anchored ribosome-binding protein
MNTPTGFLDNLIVAVRENPLAAALIGGGALWLLAGEGVGRSAAAAASPLVDNRRSQNEKMPELHRMAAPPTAPDLEHEGSFRFGEMLRHTGEAASNAFSEAGETIHNKLDESVGHARDSFNSLRDPGKRAVAKTQSLLTDMFEGQPLVLGAIGMAIGAAVAGAVRSSAFENEWMGEASDDARDDLTRRARAVSDSLNKASVTLKKELEETGAEVADRVLQVGANAATAVKDKIRSP